MIVKYTLPISYFVGVLLVSVTANVIPRKCANIRLSAFDDFEVLSSEATEVHNLSPAEGVTLPSFCNLSAIITHPGANDAVVVGVWLPLDDWNGKFLATGGGGYAAGHEYSLLEPILQGYATAFTDAGLSLNNTVDPGTGAWILEKPGQVNEGLVENFAHRSMHDMVTLAKRAIKRLYGKKQTYSYYMGCSTGGRQGYVFAQQYPEDFDGIVANAPALNSLQLVPSMAWPTAVMNDMGAVPQCIMDIYLQNIISECDPVDAAEDDLITYPNKCDYDTGALVGKKLQCPELGKKIAITRKHAKVVSEILEGPRSKNGKFLWYGLAPGTPFQDLANTTTVNGKTETVLPMLAGPWLQLALEKDPNREVANLSVSELVSWFSQSAEEYAETLGEEEADLSEFQRRGGKLLTWHGMADSLINYEGTLHYRERLQRNMGRHEDLNDFYRVFLAPGVGHCAGGNGPLPLDPLAALIDWVEQDSTPETLFSEVINEQGVSVTRNLCTYPDRLKYTGGDVNKAESFTCKGRGKH